MKTQATLPFKCFIEDGAKFHEPLAHHDGVPLASIIQDATGTFFFGLAVHHPEWDWPLCVVPVNEAGLARLNLPDEDWPVGSINLFRDIMTPCDGYYLWEMLGELPLGEDRIEYFSGPVPEDYMPDKID